MAILESEPFDYFGNSNGLQIITTEDMGKKLAGGKDIKPVNLNIVLRDVKNEEAAKIGIENVVKSNPALMKTNNIDYNRTKKSTMLMVQILLYGFILVVTLIGSVNMYKYINNKYYS